MIRVRPSYGIYVLLLHGLLQFESLVTCKMYPKSTPEKLKKPFDRGLDAVKGQKPRLAVVGRRGHLAAQVRVGAAPGLLAL